MIGAIFLGIIVILAGIVVLAMIAELIDGARFYAFELIPGMICGVKEDIQRVIRNAKAKKVYSDAVRKERARIRAIIEAAATK